MRKETIEDGNSTDKPFEEKNQYYIKELFELDYYIRGLNPTQQDAYRDGWRINSSDDTCINLSIEIPLIL